MSNFFANKCVLEGLYKLCLHICRLSKSKNSKTSETPKKVLSLLLEVHASGLKGWKLFTFRLPDVQI